MAELSHRKRSRADECADEFADADDGAKRLREDLLSLLDDSDAVPDRDSPSQDLDSVIRSFEKEISGSSSPRAGNFVDLTSDFGDLLTDLGQLLGNGDFDVPAPGDSGDGVEFLRVASDSSGIGEFWNFQDELASFDSFGYDMGYLQANNGNSGEGDSDEYVTLDGIFNYSDVNFGSDITWRPETLPTL